jgi:serine protease Do
MIKMFKNLYFIWTRAFSNKVRFSFYSIICVITLLCACISNASVVAKDGYADIVAPLIPAVVNISIKNKSAPPEGMNNFFPEGSQFEEFQKFFERFGQMQGMDDEERSDKMNSAGSGFIISPDGYIVTNNHVIENAEKITITLNDNKKLEAKLIGADSRTDLALLKIESKAPFPFVKFANSDESRVGDFVIAIGNPFGLGITVTSGIISAQARDINTNSGNIIDNFIQTDAAINQGNSGGPIFNLKGEVIGINFAILTPTGGNVGVGFAVPSSAAQPIINQLIKTGKVHHGWLGVVIQSTTDVAEGLGLDEGIGSLIVNISPNSPAEKAGIQVGDIILKFDGKEVTANRKLPRIVAETPVGKKVLVELMSKGKKKTIDLIVGENNGQESVEKEEISKSLYGMKLSPLNEEIRRKLGLKSGVSGVLVSNVERKSLASRYGIKRGDVINAVNQQTIASPEELLKMIDQAKQMKRKSVMLLIYRNGGIIFLNIPVLENK